MTTGTRSNNFLMGIGMEKKSLMPSDLFPAEAWMRSSPSLRLLESLGGIGKKGHNMRRREHVQKSSPVLMMQVLETYPLFSCR